MKELALSVAVVKADGQVSAEASSTPHTLDRLIFIRQVLVESPSYEVAAEAEDNYHHVESFAAELLGKVVGKMHVSLAPVIGGCVVDGVCTRKMGFHLLCTSHREQESECRSTSLISRFQ